MTACFKKLYNTRVGWCVLLLGLHDFCYNGILVCSSRFLASSTL